MPEIRCSPDGPYIVSDVPELLNSRGEPIAPEDDDPERYLCRCGGSANKPYCDGTHRRNGFTSARLRGVPPASQPDRYEGRDLTVLDDRPICAHAGHCTDNLATAFRLGGEPWIAPDQADTEAVLAAVRRCPSGALQAERNGVRVAFGERKARITVSKDGPYEVEGGFSLVDEAPGQQPVDAQRYTLCRCGQSRNKPFCDGTHWKAEFRDERN